jgi:hypothetical protein
MVPGAQTVSVRQEDLPALDGEGKGLVGERDVQLPSQIIADPEIVIPADICYREARAAKLPELLQDSDVLLGNGIAVLEPEIEEIPGDVERGALGEHGVEEAEKVPLAGAIRVGRTLAQMGVGDKIGASGVGHAASV